MPKRPLPLGVKLQSQNAKKVFNGVRFDIYQWQQKLFDGTTATFEIVKRDDTVIVLAVMDNQIIAVRERQPHWDKDALVMPGGIAHSDEELEVAARREFEEETGFVFKNYYLVDMSYPTPGIEWGRYIFVAKDLIKTQSKRLDAGEQNEVIKISLTDFVNMLRDEKFLYPIPFAEKLVLKGKVAELMNMFENPSKYAIC